MSKKFFDIIPPNYLRQKTFQPEKEVSIKIKPKRIFLKSTVLFLVFVVLLGTSVFLLFSKIKIEIWPKTESLNLKTVITVNPEIEKTNVAFWLENKVISGKIFEDLKTGFQEFPASGKTVKKEKARGIIRVYNAYSTSPRTLIPSRFVSANGKLFWSTKTIVIPAGKYEKGKLIPGEIDVELEATEPGEDYNIGPSTFALPALAGTPLYTTIYGKSFSVMTGGFEGEVPQVTKEDLERAKNFLTEKVKNESKEFLKASLAQDFILLDETITQELTESNSSLTPPQEAESFELEIKVKSKGIGFRKSDIENFSKGLINLTISEDKKLQEESLEIGYLVQSMNIESRKIVLELAVKAKIYSDIDLAELKKALFGKSFKESKIFLENLPQVTKVEIKSWPFWRKRAPENIEKMEIRLNLD